MKKVIIFGAGFYGSRAYYKLKEYEEVAYYVDNNSNMQGTKLHGIPIISADELKRIYDPIVYDIIIVCANAYGAIENQLYDMGIVEYYVMLSGFLYRSSVKEKMFPVERYNYQYYKKESGEKNILFVQDVACIRTRKTATVMKKNGYKVFLLYTVAPPLIVDTGFAETYDGIYTFDTQDAFVDFVENSDFDIVHSSNEPDILTNLLLMTKKHIIFDTHDMMSIRRPENIEKLVFEYIANVASDGNIYTSALAVDIAKKKYGLENKEIIAWENIVFDQEKIVNNYEKLSSIDGEIHCVYEGGINGKDKFSHRFFEDIWKKIADYGIHIHFYTQVDYVYCKELETKSKYFHYEGNLDTRALIQEMTKYDCGLLLLNINYQNESIAASASPNKLYEYINAGLPVAVNNTGSLVADFVEKYSVGKQVDLEKDIKQQITEISQISIDKNFLINNKLTMMSRSQELIDFYERVKRRKVVR